jgi:predicted O-linked N-acetylglucosamine transferase (SPINDLY family)/ubiquinone/menaquinone biosynthesis C-methylase UbiE
MEKYIEKSFGIAIEQVKQGTLELNELLSLSDRLNVAGQPDLSIMLYRMWIEHTESPVAFVAYFNLGALLTSAGDDTAAEQAYWQAIALKSDFIQARLNLGTVLERLGRQEEALEQWRQVLAFPVPEDKTLHLHALNNSGRLLEVRQQYLEAEELLKKSLLMEPDQPPVIQHWVHLRQKQCKWPVFGGLKGMGTTDLLNSRVSALCMLGLSDDPVMQLAAAKRFVDDMVSAPVDALCNANGYGHKRLRIGYLSSNFSIHAVSLLTVEMYELHNRERVEVYGFCWSSEDVTPYRSRIANAMDHYIRIADMSDEDAAKCIRSHEIDILIDLQGLTSGARPNILSARPAPIQISYLGFPGTTGLPCNDYVIADKFVLPEELTPYFTEKPLYMPNSFQVSDRGRIVGKCPTRTACGLPEDAFVFCSFNNNYKFTPEVFSTWMRILKRVPKSVLWLLADNEWSRENLCKTAGKFGIKRERLIFASRVAPPDYLARYQVADLFLDTCPFNAGTTANDALWMGLPILTCAGRTFASRMAGSLLTTLGLPELVTYNMDDYEELAVNLAKNRKRVVNYRRHLETVRSSNALFDTPRFVRDLEDVLEKLVASQWSTDSLLQNPIEIEADEAVPVPVRPCDHDSELGLNEDILQKLPLSARFILDVGCGEGALGQAFHAKFSGVRYVGVEISEQSACKAAEHLDYVIPGDIEKTSVYAELDRMCGNSRFDALVLDRTLEHMHNPKQVLNDLRGLMLPGAVCLACVANVSHWAVLIQQLRGRWDGLGTLDEASIRFFTRYTIVELFKQSGWTVLEVSPRVTSNAAAPINLFEPVGAAFGVSLSDMNEDLSANQWIVRAVNGVAGG